MELPLLRSLFSASFSNFTGDLKLKVDRGLQSKSFYLSDIKPQEQGRKISTVSSALPETAASVAIAATVVGAAATLLVRRTKGSEATEIPMKTCEDCGGSGICSECNGEGFVLKKLSDVSAERARITAKNAATRYTAGLPKKWSYCTKCSSSRSCTTCDGRGKLSF
ncbi:uncharacterized protein LOC116145028 isoform X2 [Pistacia vera]|uniref:uncharacterized protein LOC116145028 isoform X1 n=1 Tax=Pistacia vera TaxID=55513 RepID=UPI001262C6FC|nr:uncharacterized protein LOC116145028 isoform X1 [Pistacia vera]XP_031286347.1 uncharacterized protein LOC116145028 isoform X2 [Pistacia vera]